MRYAIRVGRLRRDRGFSVARPTALGNPFVIGADGDRDAVIRRYRTWLPGAYASEPRVRAALDRIVAAARERDVTLLCYCAPLACHAAAVADFVRERLDASAEEASAAHHARREAASGRSGTKPGSAPSRIVT